MNMPTEWDRSEGRRRVDGPGRPGTSDTLQAEGCKAHFGGLLHWLKAGREGAIQR